MKPSQVFRVEPACRMERAADWSPRLVWDAQILDAFGGVRMSCGHGHLTATQAETCGKATLEAYDRRVSSTRG